MVLEALFDDLGSGGVSERFDGNRLVENVGEEEHGKGEKKPNGADAEEDDVAVFLVDESANEDAETVAEAGIETAEKTLCSGTQARRSNVMDVGNGGSPHGTKVGTVEDFSKEDIPGIGEHGVGRETDGATNAGHVEHVAFTKDA